ncbi:MAG: hypothetical protein M1820_004751 [Bogoriella megaspora]|nr:MAG: hypothetical protein M1820_004751 [Bogoriella megaspora]
MTSQPGRWEAISFQSYPETRNVQAIDIYTVNRDHSWPVRNFATRMRRRQPRYQFGSSGMEELFEDPGVHFNEKVPPRFLVRIIGDLGSVFEKGLLSIIYPEICETEYLHIAEPTERDRAFDLTIEGFLMNGSIEKLVPDFSILTENKEQELLQMASSWITARRLARDINILNGTSLVAALGPGLKCLCEASLAIDAEIYDRSSEISAEMQELLDIGESPEVEEYEEAEV